MDSKIEFAAAMFLVVAFAPMGTQDKQCPYILEEDLIKSPGLKCSVSEFMPGSIAKCRCETPYYMDTKEVSTMKCESDGRWIRELDDGIRSAQLPKCKKLCSHKTPSPPLYCNVTGYKHGDQIICECLPEDEYYAEGVSVFECGADGTWSGTKWPECKNKCPKLPSKAPLYCNVSGYKFGNRASCRCLPEAEYFTDGSTDFGCVYKLKEKHGTLVFDHAKWSNEHRSSNMPVCKKYCTELKEPPPPLDCSISGNKAGDKAYCSCYPSAEYYTEGVTVLECSSNGRWNAEFPTCKKATTISTTTTTTSKTTTTTLRINTIYTKGDDTDSPPNEDTTNNNSEKNVAGRSMVAMAITMAILCMLLWNVDCGMGALLMVIEPFAQVI